MRAGRRRTIAHPHRSALFGAAIGFCLTSPLTFGAAPAAPQPAVGGMQDPAASPAQSAMPAASGTAASPAARSTAAAEDIRDIRGPRPVASPWVLWALAGGGILAASIAYALWRWIRRRRNVPEPSDFEVALGRLEAAHALMQPGRAREFSIEVSGIVREYIERRFRVMAAHRTTHEFLHDLVHSAAPALAAHRESLGEFLQSCDLAKFGGWNLTIEQMSAMLESARRFIRSAAASADAPESGSAQPGAAPAEPNVHSASGEPRVSLPST
jgi:hypothetical protein